MKILPWLILSMFALKLGAFCRARETAAQQAFRRFIASTLFVFVRGLSYSCLKWPRSKGAALGESGLKTADRGSRKQDKESTRYRRKPWQCVPPLAVTRRQVT